MSFGGMGVAALAVTAVPDRGKGRGPRIASDAFRTGRTAPDTNQPTRVPQSLARAPRHAQPAMARLVYTLTACP